MDEQSIVDYWVASRCRFDRWGYDLRTYAKAAEKSDSRPLTPRLFRLASEIEVSEVLARTLASLGYAHDTATGRQDTAPITTNILAGHRDITKRLNELIANRDDTAFRDVVRFRDLRSKLRSLTDELVACYLPFAQVAPFAHDPRQVVKHGQRAASRVARGGESADWSTLQSTIATFRNLCNEYGPNNEENHRVAAAAMGFFAPELFDSYGLLPQHLATSARTRRRGNQRAARRMDGHRGLGESPAGEPHRRVVAWFSKGIVRASTTVENCSVTASLGLLNSSPEYYCFQNCVGKGLPPYALDCHYQPKRWVWEKPPLL